jgi:predicted ribosomally synthesized peptide with SipW-like signal peptide
MKKKLLLSVIAITVVASLAIGGTLMLFTSQTEVAENVATFGNLDILLLENVEGEDDPVVGHDYGELFPGDSPRKEPFVVHAESGNNAAGANAYVRLLVRVDVTPNRAFGEWTVADQIFDDLVINGPAGEIAGWVRVLHDPATEGSIPFAIFEYRNADGTLAELVYRNETIPLFNNLVINRNFDNAHVANTEISVDVFAQAVQSRNNARTADNEPFSVFADAFPE